MSFQKGNSSFTIDRYAKHVGIGTSSLKMILSGKRKPTVHQVLAVARGLRLAAPDVSYLETLCLRESSKNKWEKSYFTKNLDEKKKVIKLQTVTTSQKDLLEDVRILPLLVYLLECADAEVDVQFVSREIGATAEWVSSLISKFEKEGILQKRNDGKFHVAFSKFSHRVLQKKYYKLLLSDLAHRVEKNYDEPTSFFVNYAFSTTEENLMKIQLDLKGVVEKYMSEVSQPKDRVIAQACFQVFPVIGSPRI